MIAAYDEDQCQPELSHGQAATGPGPSRVFLSFQLLS
jgi:hypothetical protein